MSGPRVIYVEPGEMVELRIVSEGFEKNARDWNAQARPGKILMLVNGSDSVSFADHAVRPVPWGSGLKACTPRQDQGSSQ